MKGSAPNLSKIGSQTEATKNPKQNLWGGKYASRHNSKTSSNVISTTEPAKINVTSRAISSPSRSLLMNEREPVTGPALGTVVVAVAIRALTPVLLNLVQVLHFFGGNFLRKLRVGKRLDLTLPVSHHPFEEALDGVPLGTVRKLGRNKQPGETRNGIRRLPWSIRDGDAEIVRHSLRGTCGSGRHAGEISFDHFSGRILHLTVWHLVLYRIDEFNVTQSIWRLLHQASDALVAFAAEAHRPVHRRALAHFVFPFIADLR